MTSEGWGAPVAEATVAPVETPEAFTVRRNSEIENWLKVKGDLDNAKTLEMQFRNKVTQTCFSAPTKGTNRYELSNGYKLKLVYGLTYTLGIKDMVDPTNPIDKIPVNRQVAMLCDAIADLGNEGPELAERLIRWKPELVASEYEKLNPEYPTHKQVKDLIDALLTVKPASPQLTFEQPK